jgi:lipopolysaccharide transport system ATP-binding protein
MSIAVSVEHLSKVYRLGAIGGTALHEDLSRWWARLRGKPDPFLPVGAEHHNRLSGQQFLALDDVSFEVPQGEILGVVGRNGAGKSTLLKILSQVTGPTAGRIRLRGRVASLLEVGTGFHPELTGRENVFLNGAIMGMTKAEIRRKFDDIVGFSECGEFIDTPVKRYSSGMYVRLAFAVAAHLEPEILIVDEVLAVGDAQFQKKCLGKMGEVSRGGRTVLFVSHNMVAVKSLCRNAVLLRDGKLEMQGSAESVVSAYLREVHDQAETREWATPDTAPGAHAVRLRRVSVSAAERRADGLLGMSTPIKVDTDFWVLQNGAHLNLTYVLYNEEGAAVLTTYCKPEKRQAGCYSALFTLPGGLLNSGHYTLRLIVVEDEARIIYQNETMASFTIVDDVAREHAWTGRSPGVVQAHTAWTVTLLEDPVAAAAAPPS